MLRRIAIPFLRYRIDSFDGKTPFDFDNCCGGSNDKLGRFLFGLANREKICGWLL